MPSTQKAAMMEIADRSGCTSVTMYALVLKHFTVLPPQSTTVRCSTMTALTNQEYSPFLSPAVQSASLPTFHTKQVLFDEINTIQLVRHEQVLCWMGEGFLPLLAT